MNILAIDTATDYCSCAVQVGDQVIAHSQNAPQQQAALILPMIEQILMRANLTLPQINLLAFTHGPGSFTGIRITASVIQALGFAMNVPIVGVSTLRVLAQQAWRLYQTKHALSALDARMKEIYWGEFLLDQDGCMQLIGKQQVAAVTTVKIIDHSPLVGIGSAWDCYAELLTHQCKQTKPGIIFEAYPQAQDILPLAQQAHLKGETLIAEAALPLYLRNQVV